MARWVNRLLSKVYTRVPALSERYGRRAGSFDDVPLPNLAALRRPMHEARIAVATAGGVHLAGQPPFDMQNPEGDGSWRSIPQGAPRQELVITHDYYDHNRLAELATAGMIGEPAPRHVGIMGHLSGAQLARLVDRSASEIVSQFADDAVDLVVAVPG
jgi:D-proline reductase (dithiol) PrdB